LAGSYEIGTSPDLVITVRAFEGLEELANIWRKRKWPVPMMG
jgi:hypothetical protein